MSSIKLIDLPKGITIPSQLKKLAEEKPDKQAYIFIDKLSNKTILTRKDVWDKSRKFAAILRRHGVQKGDLVCNTLINSPERLITSLGSIVAGAVSQHGQIFLADGEDLIHNCLVAKSKAIIVDPGQAKGALPILKRIEYKDENTGEIRYTGLPDLKTVINVTVSCCQGNADTPFKRGHQCLEDEQEMFEETDITEDDTAIICCTSGTTGFSKQVPYSHRSSLLSSRSFGFGQGVTASETSKFFNCFSLGWLGGLPMVYPVYGATRVLIDLAQGMAENSGQQIVTILNNEDIDCAALVPQQIEAITKCISSGHKLNRRLRTCFTGGMPNTRRILRGLGIIFDELVIIFGATEIGVAALIRLDVGSSFEDYGVGSLIEGFKAKVVDKDHNEVPTGSIGELAILSGTMTSSYLNEPGKTQKATMKDGFFLMGDSGFQDENGMYYVMGREAHIIHKGAFIHYPGWIESRILKCPGVEEVIVINVPDPVFNHEICACVIPSHEGPVLTEMKLQEFCTNLFLLDYNSEMSAIPKYYLFFESYPRNANGKQDRKLLREEACKRLNIDY